MRLKDQNSKHLLKVEINWLMISFYFIGLIPLWVWSNTEREPTYAMPLKVNHQLNNSNILSKMLRTPTKFMNMAHSILKMWLLLMRMVEGQDHGTIKVAPSMASGRLSQTGIPYALIDLISIFIGNSVMIHLGIIYGQKYKGRTSSMEDWVSQQPIYWWPMESKIHGDGLVCNNPRAI